MGNILHFRRAMQGFHRDDVVNYIEYLNNQHAAQVEQLKSQLQNAQAAPAQDEALRAQLEAEQARSADLEAQLEVALARCAELEAQAPIASEPAQPADSELEIYRRAERVERQARERASQIYAEANAVLADATVMVESAAEKMAAQLQQCQDATDAAKATLQDAVASLYAIRPEEE